MPAQSKPQNVDIKSSDGVVLKASYFSPGRRGPGIVLFHQCSDGGSRRLWDGLAADLVAAGIHVVTFDDRGFGETGGNVPGPPPPPSLAGGNAPPPPPPSSKPGPPPNAMLWGVSPFPPGDGDAALAYLKAQKDVDPVRLATGGSSCGATDAGNLAAQAREIKALFLLSGIPTRQAVSHIETTPSLAIFVAYAEQDMRDTPINTLRGLSKNPQSVEKKYPGNDHGMALFAKHSDLQRAVVAWLQAQLK
jgi:dienelactone hydrolase